MKKRVHFMGIGGSGMSGVALIAHNQGYKISGCDLLTETPYISILKKLDVPIFSGHSTDHLKDVDILTVTPAAYFQNADHPEVVLGKKRKIIMTWQSFLGRYLQKGKKVICVAGTHGKSSTTAMIALLFEKAGLNPNVIIGAEIKEWKANYRVGKGDAFITESDEFFDNFLNYHPEVIILNNIEFDHPDYFKDESQLLKSFAKHIKNLKGLKILIFNQDSVGIQKLFKILNSKTLENLRLYGYTVKDKPLVAVKKSFKAENISLDETHTSFEVKGKSYKLKIPGLYNVSNSLGVIILGEVFKVDYKILKNSLWNYNGIGRRLELIGSPHNIKIYDDYAHHPTAIKVTLGALRQKYPKENITAIVEPHTFSRTKALLSLYKDAFDDANKVIIAPIFKSRDSSDFGISGRSIVEVSKSKNVSYIDNFDKIVSLVKESAKSGDIIIVMGAGKSYELARNILKALKK